MYDPTENDHSRIEAAESTPLLRAEEEHDLVYERFTPARKRVLLTFVSFAGLVPCTHLSCTRRPSPHKLFDSVCVWFVHSRNPSNCLRHEVYCTSYWVRIQNCTERCLVYQSHVRMMVSMSILCVAIGNLVWASYSGFCTLVHTANCLS
jgi:hypothetical protein